MAASLLASEGWLILERNYRTRTGEIDIIASKAETLAFVEVKTWRFLGPEALENAVGARKRRRIVETSKIFLARHREYNNMKLRYDLFLYQGRGELSRFESAFTGEL